MLSFLLGIACIVGVVAVARGRRRWGRWTRRGPLFGCGPGELGGRYGGDRWGRHGDLGYGGSFWAQSFRARGLFERLETTPAQEKVIASAAEQLRQTREKLREELARLRHEVAQALRAEQFNPASMREIFARHDLLISDLRTVALEVLSKIDEALDDRQRKILAELIEPGAGFHRGAAGYGGYV